MKKETNAEGNDDRFLQRTYKIAQIVALFGTPIAVAFIGWAAQRSAADANMHSQTLAANIAASAQKAATESGIQRDLVQTAVQVLRSPRQPEDAAIRDWATKVMGKYSPVTFSTKEANQLSRSAFSMLEENPLLKPAMAGRAPCPVVDLKTMPTAQAETVHQLEVLCARNQKDLFWLKVFIGLVRGSPSASAPISTSDSGISR